MRALAEEIRIEIAEDRLMGRVHVSIFRPAAYPLNASPSFTVKSRPTAGWTGASYSATCWMSLATSAVQPV